MKEKLIEYVKDLREDLKNRNKEFDNLLKLCDDELNKDLKNQFLKQLSNVAGRIDTLKSIIECLEGFIDGSL